MSFPLLLLLLPLLISAETPCPFGATFFKETGHCYLVSKLNAHWRASESICNHLGGHLASINSQKENDFVYKTIAKSGQNAWLGTHFVNGSLVNTDGTNVEFTNFQKGGYAIADNSVVALVSGQTLNFLSNGKWIVSKDELNFTLPFVCELPVCHDGQAPPSLLKIRNLNSGLSYGPLTKSWYYGNQKVFSTYQQAATVCSSVAGHLPTVVSLLHNVEVVLKGKQLNVQKVVPLGFHSGLFGKWSWDDQTNSNYTNWAPGLPLSNVDQRAMVSLEDTFWYSSSIFDYFPKNFLCQFQVNRPQTC